MAIKIITNREGDALTTTADVLAHVVNTQGVMGAGIAAQIRKKWPSVYDHYKKLLEVSTRKGSWCLGGSYNVPTGPGTDPSLIVCNLFAQDSIERGKRNLNYEALYTALEHCKAEMKNLKLYSLAIPYKMGAGLAGGDWNIVLAMVMSIFENDPEEFNLEIWKLN